LREFFLLGSREAESHSETEVQQMLKETIEEMASESFAYDEELRDLLIAISVVAKMLATKMEKKKGEQTNEQNE